MGLVLGKMPEHETICFFRVKWPQPAIKGSWREAVTATLVLTSLGSGTWCFALCGAPTSKVFDAFGICGFRPQ